MLYMVGYTQERDGSVFFEPKTLFQCWGILSESTVALGRPSAHQTCGTSDNKVSFILVCAAPIKPGGSIAGFVQAG